jgi:transcriptional regulator with XRE-family HTH domain
MSPEEKHVLSVLKTTMRVLGCSNRDLERELKLSSSYLSRLFSGDLDLRYSHILALSRAMGLAPGEILRLIYPPEPGPRSPAAERLKRFRESLQTSEPRVAPEPSWQEIEMAEAIERVLNGIVETLGSVALWNPQAAAEPDPLPDPLPALPRRKRRPRK